MEYGVAPMHEKQMLLLAAVALHLAVSPVGVVCSSIGLWPVSEPIFSSHTNTSGTGFLLEDKPAISTRQLKFNHMAEAAEYYIVKSITGHEPP